MHLRPGVLLHDVSRLRRTVFDQRLRPLGITRSQWWVLAALSRHDGAPMSQIELARTLDVGKVTLGGLVDRLEAPGLLARLPDPRDGRSKLVKPTRKGLGLITKVERIADEINAQVMKGLSAGEQKTLVSLLTRLKDNLIGLDAVPSTVTGRARDGADAEPVGRAKPAAKTKAATRRTGKPANRSRK